MLSLSAAIFTTVFQDINKSLYGDFITSSKTMFDGLMASYGYKGFGEYEMLHMVMLWTHIFIANILLLNYLIAILSDSYVGMLEKGKFLYKVIVYQYCERYMVGLENEKYGQLVIQSAPLAVLNFPITILTIIPKIPDWVLISVSNGFGLFMFWLENIAWLSLFLTFEVVLTPIVYFKNLFVVAYVSQGALLKIWNTLAWLFAGPIYIVFFILRDLWYMFRILTMH